jgi:hypothetical protein
MSWRIPELSPICGQFLSNPIEPRPGQLSSRDEGHQGGVHHAAMHSKLAVIH